MNSVRAGLVPGRRSDCRSENADRFAEPTSPPPKPRKTDAARGPWTGFPTVVCRLWTRGCPNAGGEYAAASPAPPKAAPLPEETIGQNRRTAKKKLTRGAAVVAWTKYMGPPLRKELRMKAM